MSRSPARPGSTAPESLTAPRFRAARVALTALVTWISLVGATAAAQPAPARPGAAASPPGALRAAPALPRAPGAAAAAAKAPAAPAIAFTGALVFTGAGDPIADATVVIEGGVIRAVGKGIAPPAGAEIVKAKDMVVTPGLVDSITSVGVIEVGLEPGTRDDSLRGTDDRIRAGFRVVDGYNPASPLIPITRAEGITSVGVVPSGGLIAGQSAWADLDGATTAEAIALAPLALHVSLGPDAAGEHAGHATALLRLREALDDARVFTRSRAAWERNQTRRFAPSRLDLEALVQALDGKVPVVFNVDREADILSALALSREQKLRPIIAGGAEAWKVAPALAAAKVPVIINPLANLPSFDALAARDDSAALLHTAGVPLILSTGDTHNARKLRQIAGNAVRAGLPRAAAIEAMTHAPAEAFGLGARYGTLAPGKIANLVLWSDDPLELDTQVVELVIHGKKVSLKTRQSALLERYRRLPR